MTISIIETIRRLEDQIKTTNQATQHWTFFNRNKEFVRRQVSIGVELVCQLRSIMNNEAVGKPEVMTAFLNAISKLQEEFIFMHSNMGNRNFNTTYGSDGSMYWFPATSLKRHLSIKLFIMNILKII